MAEHNKYLILFVKRITWSPRAYIQFHNHDRQLVSLYSIQNLYSIQIASNGRLGPTCSSTTTTASLSPSLRSKTSIRSKKRITWSPRAYMQFHNHDRQLVSLYSIQKAHHMVASGLRRQYLDVPSPLFDFYYDIDMFFCTQTF